MTFLGRFVAKNNLTAVSYCFCSIHFTIYDVSYCVVVNSKRTFYDNILGRHCHRRFTPTTEGVPLLSWLVNQCNVTAISYRNNLVLFTINLINHIICINSKCTLNNNITCRHCSRSFAPTTEGIALLCRLVTKNDFTTISNAICCPRFAVNLIHHSITVYGKYTINGYILSWHILWYILPTTESVTFLNWEFRKIYHRTIFNKFTLILYTINDVYYLITIDHKRRSYFEIFRRHCLRYITPATESVTFLDRMFGSYNFLTICYAICCINLTVDHVGHCVIVNCK